MSGLHGYDDWLDNYGNPGIYEDQPDEIEHPEEEPMDNDEVTPEGEGMDKETLVSIILGYNVTLAARAALGDGLEREHVANVLADLANAIRNPDSVAEDMEPVYVPNLLDELTS